MNRILRCDWLPERARCRYLARSGLPCFPQENSFIFSYNKSLIDQACEVKMAGYWPRSIFLRVYGPQLRLGP